MFGNAGQSIGQDFSNLGTGVQQNIAQPVEQAAGNVHNAITQDFHNWQATQANNQRQIGQQNQNFNNSIGQGWSNFTNHQFVPGGMTFNQIGQDIVHNPGSYNVINNAVNSPYFQNKVYNPISQGVQQFTKPGLMNKVIGGATAAGGVWGAMPSGMIFNEGYGAAGGAIRSARTGQPLAQSVIQGLNQPTDIGGSGLGIKNPLLATGVDLLAGNPKALLTKGPKLLGAVKGMLSPNPTIDEAAAKAIPQLLDKYNNNNFTIADQQAADSLIKQYNPIPKSVLKTIPPEQQTYRQLNELAGQLTPNQDYMYRQLPGMNAFAGKGQTGKVTGLAGTTDNAATKLPQTTGYFNNERGGVRMDLGLGGDKTSSGETNPLVQEAQKYATPEEFIKAQATPETVKVWNKSKFSTDGAYADIPVTRRVDNITLYQGGSNEGRQFWTPDKKYSSQFGEVKRKDWLIL